MDAVEACLTQLAQVIEAMPRHQNWDVSDVLVDAWRRRSMVFLLGNGGSAATASHMANDLNKLTIVPGQPRFRAPALTDNVPLMTAWGNDTDYENTFVEQMLNFLEPDDVAIGISASGNSPNDLKAMQVARANGAVTIAFSGWDGGKLGHMATGVRYRMPWSSSSTTSTISSTAQLIWTC